MNRQRGADAGRAVMQSGRILARAGMDRATDRVLSVDTGGQMRLGELEAPNRGWYVPSPWLQLFRSLRSLAVGPGDVLVDYGAGKGRVLVAAMSFPFHRIVGLEISPHLAAVARANVQRRTGRRRSGEVHVVVGDASRWEVSDDTTVIYMYSPFTGSVFSSCVSRILDSVDRRPRRVRFVYCNPFEHNYLLSTGRFEPVSAIAVPDSRKIPVTQDIVTYEVRTRSAVPTASAGRAAGEWAGLRDTAGLLSGFESASGPS
jgi:SAM-dependent methyltransferase